MSTKRNQLETIQTYFCTFTCKNWLHLFEITNLYAEVYKWFCLLVEKKNDIEGFVIMPNYLHLLIFINEEDNINMLLANGKRFPAYEIVKLELQQQYNILKQLQLAVTTKEKERNKKHRVAVSCWLLANTKAGLHASTMKEV